MKHSTELHFQCFDTKQRQNEHRIRWAKIKSIENRNDERKEEEIGENEKERERSK